MHQARLLYQGHGSYRITTGEGKVIYVDPYAGGGYDLIDWHGNVLLSGSSGYSMSANTMTTMRWIRWRSKRTEGSCARQIP